MTTQTITDLDRENGLVAMRGEVRCMSCGHTDAGNMVDACECCRLAIAEHPHQLAFEVYFPELPAHRVREVRIEARRILQAAVDQIRAMGIDADVSKSYDGSRECDACEHADLLRVLAESEPR
jgi:hypothetical protein